MRLTDHLGGIIPKDLLGDLTGHYDVIGTVAIVTVPACLHEYKNAIAGAIRSSRPSVTTVLNKISPVGGSGRIAGYEILSGTDTVTRCREGGFVYDLDVRTTFFNPRLAAERARISGLVKSGESILVPFCGVGPFVIPVAARGARVVAVEKNAEAFLWLLENMKTNRVSDRITAICGDAFNHCIQHRQGFDRLIIPTPYGMDAILPVLSPLVRPGGMLHYYTFRNRKQALLLADEFRRDGWDIVRVRKCGNVAPSVSRWVFDMMAASP